MRKKRNLFIILGLIVILGTYFIFVKKNGNDFETAEVVRGEIISEIFESGIIKKGEEVNLSFLGGGRIKEIYVTEGDQIKKGEQLIELEDDNLKIQISRALAGLRIAESSYAKLISGASIEDIRIVEMAFLNAEKDHKSAINNLEKIKITTKEKITKIYGDSSSVLNDSYIKANSAYEVINEISKTYFTGFSTEYSRKAIENKDRIKYSADAIKTSRDSFKESDSFQDMKNYLIETEKNLKDIFNNINTFAEVFKEPIYRDASKQDLDDITNQKNIINNQIATLTSLINNASLTNSTNEIEINNAESQVISAQNRVDSAFLELEKIKSSADEIDLKQAMARIDQAKAEVELLEMSLRNLIITTPLSGKILKIYVQKQEIIQPGTPIITFVPDGKYQIEANIYEGDISKIQIGNKTKIELVAFPDQTFDGEVIFIDSASKIIDGVVYYKTIISFENYPEGIMTNMTADVAIQTDKKENVLIISERLVHKDGDKEYVKVLEDGLEKMVEVELGLRGEKRMVEVLSGLEEGEIILVD